MTLFLAWSVFTHLLQADAEFYLRELARVLASRRRGGDHMVPLRQDRFPMMQAFQHALYISDFDPTNAVIFDRGWPGGGRRRGSDHDQKTTGSCRTSMDVRAEAGFISASTLRSPK